MRKKALVTCSFFKFTSSLIKMSKLIKSMFSIRGSSSFFKLKRLLSTKTFEHSLHYSQPSIKPNLEDKKAIKELKNLNSDTFGTLEDSYLIGSLKSEHEKDDDDNYERLEINRDRKHAMHYRRVLTDLIHRPNSKPMLVQALKLFDEMKFDDRKIPKPYHYTLLITGCADHGYTRKAFELFEQMLKQKLKPTQAVVTSMFNACAECPLKDYGLEKAHYLRKWLTEIGTLFNTKNYHSMIKAFGKLGDMKTAFQIVDEMVANRQTTTTETFNMLLIGCNSNQLSGFGQAIRIIRRMRYHKIARDEHTYNFLLRVTRECGIGEEDLKKSFQEWLKGENLKYFEKKLPTKVITSKKFTKEIKSHKNQQIIDDHSENINHQQHEDKNIADSFVAHNQKDANNLILISEKSNQLNKAESNDLNYPNFLTTNSSFLVAQVIDIEYESLKNPVNRLTLIGGVNGILDLMRIDGAKLSIKIFTLLLELIPDNNDAESFLITEMKKAQVQPDTGFFNILIKRRCKRNDLKSAKVGLIEMQKFNVKPDIATFGALAIGCRNKKLASQLINDIESAQLIINQVILNTLLNRAYFFRDFNYIIYILEEMQKKQIYPDKIMLENLVYLKDKVNYLLLQHEKNKIKLTGKYVDDKFLESFCKFKKFFRSWSKRAPFQKDHHPWDQFKYDERQPGFYKINEFKKEIKEKISQRPEIKEAIDKGYHIDIEDIVHDV